MDNDLFFEPEDGYWLGSDKLAFETEHLESEWPPAANPFIRRMASLTTPNRGQHNLALADFKQLLGALIAVDPHSTYRLLVVPLGRNARRLSVTLVRKEVLSMPPLRADNACAFEIAIEWMAARYSHFELSVCAEGNFWITKP